MQYDLDQISDPRRFQRLVNAILTARFGENARITPIQGKDGGSDGETADANPHMEFTIDSEFKHPNNVIIEPPQPGRYLFQAKYHRTSEHRISDLRSLVVREFKDALIKDVLNRPDRENVNYFFLVTNISASADSLKKVDNIRSDLLQGKHRLHGDIWWGERITTWLDWSPELWHTFPEIFPGSVPPVSALAATNRAEGLSRTLQVALARQYERDSQVKFRQIELEKRIVDLFVDLDANLTFDSDDPPELLFQGNISRIPAARKFYDNGEHLLHRVQQSALQLLLDDDLQIPRILLEGGPGQGKSTITQMVAQIYREKFLSVKEIENRDPTWNQLCQLRVPIRIELRDFAHWIGQEPSGSLEQYIVSNISRDSGGVDVTVDDLHRILQHSSAILLLDGLDEIGNDDLRDQVLDVALGSINRIENGLRRKIRVVLTTRPPAIVGRWSKLEGFTRVFLIPMEPRRIDEYLNRWLSAQIGTKEERTRIRTSFNSRREEAHVKALARNPMQLSVLLQFINLKGEAFPDRRAELYRDYFQIVIDRDVEKSPELREHRELVEGLHAYLGFRLHGMAEIEQNRRALNRTEIIDFSGKWLEVEGHPKGLAEKYFALGEERFGLVVALSGEGHETAYGFEVQPIQEYFAAAYISNRLANGKAHDVFESLINREYWREVALFLAGLRRPNEKADLVARAKASDNGQTVLGQQNGRTIVLELLREGVLSQPRHVQIDALQFIFGFLDRARLSVHSSPATLISALSDVGKLHGDDETKNRVREVAESVSDCNDYGFISLLHRLASDVLPKDKYMKIVLGYKGSDAETRGLVRVTRPFAVPGVLEELGSNLTYWEGIPVRVMARRLWSAAIRNGIVPAIAYPAGAHLRLILEFAIDRSVGRGQSEGVIRIEGESVPAIWKLYRNVQLIALEFTEERKGNRARTDEISADVDSTLSWSNGVSEPLTKEIEECIRDLIETSDSLLDELRRGKKQGIKESNMRYLEAIRKHINQPGITGWVAGRCGVALIQNLPYSDQKLGADMLFEEILEALFELYHLPDRVNSRGSYRIARVTVGIPHSVRLTREAALRPVHEVLADLALNRVDLRNEHHCGWLRDVPVPQSAIRPIVDICHDEMETLLRFMGSREISGDAWYYGSSGSKRLFVNDIRRVLKICRSTEDPMVLRGASTLLMNATFSRLEEAGVMLKILSAAPASPLVSMVFETRDDVRGQERGSHAKKLGLNVAHRIMKQAEVYPFQLVNSAATFLNEMEVNRSSPLFKDCPSLVQFT